LNAGKIHVSETFITKSPTILTTKHRDLAKSASTRNVSMTTQDLTKIK
jgi:hypothetical protein